MGPWGSASSRTASITSRMMAMPLLSSPPSTVVPSLRMTSPSTTGTTPSPGATVSMCADRSMGSAPSTSPSKWATRLPTSPPTALPASSIRTVAPNPSSISVRRNAMARSLRDRLSIRTSSSTRSLRRALSIKDYLLCPEGRVAAGQRPPGRPRPRGRCNRRIAERGVYYEPAGRSILGPAHAPVLAVPAGCRLPSAGGLAGPEWSGIIRPVYQPRRAVPPRGSGLREGPNHGYERFPTTCRHSL